MEESTDSYAPEDEEEARERAFAEGDLGTIQNILFGSQAKQFEERMADLERRVQSASEQLRTQLGSEIQTSEERLRGNLDSAVSEFRQASELERAHRLTSIDELEQRQRESTKELFETVGTMEREAQRNRNVLASLLESAAEQLRNGAGGTPDDH